MSTKSRSTSLIFSLRAPISGTWVGAIDAIGGSSIATPAYYVGTLIATSKAKPRLGTAGAVLFWQGGALTMEQYYGDVSARS